MQECEKKSECIFSKAQGFVKPKESSCQPKVTMKEISMDHRDKKPDSYKECGILCMTKSTVGKICRGFSWSDDTKECRLFKEPVCAANDPRGVKYYQVQREQLYSDLGLTSGLMFGPGSQGRLFWSRVYDGTRVRARPKRNPNPTQLMHCSLQSRLAFVSSVVIPEPTPPS